MQAAQLQTAARGATPLYPQPRPQQHGRIIIIRNVVAQQESVSSRENLDSR